MCTVKAKVGENILENFPTGADFGRFAEIHLNIGCQLERVALGPKAKRDHRHLISPPSRIIFSMS